jgi:hypothetical protein
MPVCPSSAENRPFLNFRGVIGSRNSRPSASVHEGANSPLSGKS